MIGNLLFKIRSPNSYPLNRTVCVCLVLWYCIQSKSWLHRWVTLSAMFTECNVQWTYCYGIVLIYRLITIVVNIPVFMFMSHELLVYLKCNQTAHYSGHSSNRSNRFFCLTMKIAYKTFSLKCFIFVYQTKICFKKSAGLRLVKMLLSLLDDSFRMNKIQQQQQNIT